MYKCNKCSKELDDNDFYNGNPFDCNQEVIDTRRSYSYVCQNCYGEGSYMHVNSKKANELNLDENNIISKELT